jgi:membrane fusion protein, multidrug efflux system
MRPHLILVSLALLTAGCDDRSATGEQAQKPVRPVLSTVVTEAKSQAPAFAGTVEARVDAEQAFLVLGRIISRPVDIGDKVKKGELLAAIDPLSLELTVASAEAQLASARASLDNAEVSYNRQKELFSSNTASEAALEEARQGFEAAQASVQQAEGNLAKAREQLSYANLTAAFDGVVRGVSAEVGQTVSAGQTVVTLAELGARDVVLDVPDTAIGQFSPGAVFEAALQLAPEIRSTARVREVAPNADPLTRTRRVKLTLDNAPEAFRLGSTVTALSTAERPAGLRVPAQALLQRQGEKPRLWVVGDQGAPGTRQVTSVEVELGRRYGAAVEILSGLKPGSRVVVAGVHNLEEGQAVKFEQDGRHE